MRVLLLRPKIVNQPHVLTPECSVYSLLPDLWIRYWRQLLISKSVDRLLVLAQVQLGADKHDGRCGTVMAHLGKPLYTIHTFLAECSFDTERLTQSYATHTNDRDTCFQ